jgi:hypothetical protein
MTFVVGLVTTTREVVAAGGGSGRRLPRHGSIERDVTT